jgi:hypothetical protein
MNRCALLTMTDIGHYVSYDHLLVEPLSRLGWQAELVAWDSPLDWGDYAAVIIRSAWDYQDRLQPFLALLEQIEHSPTRLFNPLTIVRWNVDKRYLLELQQQGCAIVPTNFVEQLRSRAIEQAFDRFNTDRLIIKPVVSAAALNTHVLGRDDWRQSWPDLQAAFQSRVAMLQPFVPAVLSDGEYSLFYFAGRYSHAIVKRPKPGDFRVQEEYGGQLISITATPDMLHAAQQALAVIAEPLLYARVDLVRLDDGSLAIMELELIEPSLYFNMDLAAANRFAEAFATMVARP